ncbi:MAG: CARDB domain-containing protein [Actinomycetota bacterium]
MVVLTVIVGLFASITSVASAAPDPMTVTVTPSQNPVPSGSSLTWTITAVNTEPDLKTVRLSDQLTGLKNLVLTSSRGYCTESNLLVTCDGGSMPGHNEVWTVTIRGIVTAGDGEVLNNTATVASRKGGQDFAVPGTGSTLVSNSPTGPLADLSTSVTAPTSVSPGGAVPYTLTVNNSGAANATDVYVTATLPGGFAITSVNGTSLFSCSAAAPTVTCLGGAVNGGTNATITINAVASMTPGTYDTTAVVDPENAIAESNDQNNTSSHRLTVGTVATPTEPITFTKTASSPVDTAKGTQVRPGDLLTYTITTTNTSSKWTASKLKITDGTQGLDAASVKATSSDPKLICTPSASQVDCRANNDNYMLDGGKSVVVKITGTVVQAPSSIITNVATLQTLQNKVSVTRTSGVSTTVRPAVELSVTQFTTPSASHLPPDSPPYRARNQFDYLITVGNSGLNDATGVVLREPLPNDVILEGYDNLAPSGGFTCSVDASTNVVTCTGGSIPGALTAPQSYPGNTRQLRLHLTAPNSTGPITSTITVDPYNAIKEPDETNNTFTTTTPIATGVDLTIAQSVRCPRDTRASTLMCDPVAPSGTVIYDLRVENIGSQDADGIKITDTLPAGARFRSAKEVPPVFGPPPHAPYVPAHGLSCTSDGGSQVTCTGGQLDGIYKAYGNLPAYPVAPLVTSGTPDAFTIEITAFAPAPFGPSDSPAATGSPILNQALVDPANAIPEISEDSNLNVLETNVGIPPAGDWGTYNELTVENAQTSPAGGLAVAPNGTLVYTLTVKNWGSDPVSNVSVYDYIPQGARFRDASGSALGSGSGGFQCSFNAGLVMCGNGSLAASTGVGSPSSATITIKLFAPDTPNEQTSNYTNHAVIDPNNAIPEADETNNVSDVALTVDIGGANAYNQLTITNEQKIPVSNGAVAPSGTLIYKITIGNTGSDTAQNVMFRDYLPAGTQFRSARNDTTGSTAGSGMFTCFHNNGVVQCGNGTLLSGGMAIVEITVFAPAQPATIQNQAVVDPDNVVPEGNERDNAAFADTIVALGGAEKYFELTSSLATDPPNAAVATDSPITYKLTVTNGGSDQAFNVKVSDYLPEHSKFVSANDDNAGTPGAFTCSASGLTVNCTGGSLPSSGSRTITIIARSPAQSDVTIVDATKPFNITNQAMVDPDNALPEGDETNNGSSVTNEVHARVDLLVDNTGGCAGKSGDTCNWAFSVTNAGPDSVSGVVVRTDLPVGVIPLDVVAPSNDWSCQITENPVNQVTCARLAPMSATTENFSVRVYVTADSGQSIDSTTVVDPDSEIQETDETNNSKWKADSA